MRSLLQKICISTITLSSALAFAEGTRTWRQSSFEELSKGTAKGVAILSSGGLELAPAFKSLNTTPSTYIWAIASDAGGNVYAAAGAPARVYQVPASGAATAIFEPQELQVQSLVVDKAGIIFAATNPDGKVYRIERRAGASAPAQDNAKAAKGAANSSWSASMYFDPGTKYIWDLALDGAGNLYVATGDQGEIFRVTPKGEHSVFFKSDEAHIRVLALDPQGNLIAGSDGSGLVYRISPAGEGFVLYSAPKKEITALTIDKQGNIYAAGVGEKHPNPSAPGNPTTPILMPAPGSAPTAGPQQPGVSAPGNAGMANRFVVQGGTIAGGSEVYRIAPDGSPARIWTSRDDLVYALAFDARGQLVAGSGNQGHVLAITAEDQYTDLLHASASQVTGFAKAPGGGLYVSTSNLGKVFLLGGAPEAEGTYESDVYDAQVFSRWGRAEFRGAGAVDLYARSGNVDNPDRHWSPWTKVDLKRDAAVTVPAARFVQWKAVLHAGDPAPRVDSVGMNYLAKNVAPDFDDVSIQPAVRYQSAPRSSTSDITISTTNGPAPPKFEAPPPSTHDPDSIGVRWSVHDDNDDQMIYSVYYRGDGETRWLLLKDNISDKFYSFDASLLPDGGYTVMVVASDAPSHSPGEALTSQRESPRFEVDSTPPAIENLAASLAAGKIRLTFRAVDSFSPIKRAECSIDAGDWQLVEPAGQISDSKTETYDASIPLPPDIGTPIPAMKQNPTSAGAEHVVIVRVYDRYDNMSSAKTAVK